MYKKRKTAFLSYILAASIVSASIIPVHAESIDGMQQTVANYSIVGATNMWDAPKLEIGQRYMGFCENNEWFSFTTKPEQTQYYVSFINKTADSMNFITGVFDELGSEITDDLFVSDFGAVKSFYLDSLQPNSTYYINVKKNGNSCDYMMLIKDVSDMQTGFGNKSYDEALFNRTEVIPGTNQDESATIAYGEKISGTIDRGLHLWYDFITAKEPAEYTLAVVNKTPNTGFIVYVLDEFGNAVQEEAHIGGDGQVHSYVLDSLKPSTIYYVAIGPNGSNADYTFFISTPAQLELPVFVVEPPAMPEITPTPELVFEEAFILDETKIMFIAESDEFIDPAAAQASLVPVAEKILAYPDHKILLAGTTATDGDQQARIELSNRRAAAVKNLLVSTFSVPENQLITVGLGFEDDPFPRGQDRDENNNFVESEGKKNRRVVVMDAEDPIAKEILNR